MSRPRAKAASRLTLTVAHSTVGAREDTRAWAPPGVKVAPPPRRLADWTRRAAWHESKVKDVARHRKRLALWRDLFCDGIQTNEQNNVSVMWWVFLKKMHKQREFKTN